MPVTTNCPPPTTRVSVNVTCHDTGLEAEPGPGQSTHGYSSSSRLAHGPSGLEFPSPTTRSTQMSPLHGTSPPGQQPHGSLSLQSNFASGDSVPGCRAAHTTPTLAGQQHSWLQQMSPRTGLPIIRVCAVYLRPATAWLWLPHQRLSLG